MFISIIPFKKTNVHIQYYSIRAHCLFDSIYVFTFTSFAVLWMFIFFLEKVCKWIIMLFCIYVKKKLTEFYRFKSLACKKTHMSTNEQEMVFN